MKTRNFWIDCLRGYSILIVMVSHLFHVEGLRKYSDPLPYLSGEMGVFIFYFISGFLVTGILYRDMKGDFINRLKVAFYFLGRRIFRLQPTVLLFLTLYFLLTPRLSSDLGLWQILLPLSNLYGGSYITWHLKTLHIEEAFYLLAALGLLLSRGGLNRKLIILLFILMSIRLVSFIGRKFGLHLPDGIMSYPYSFDPIIVGSLVGLNIDRILRTKFAKMIEARGYLIFSASMACILIIGALKPIMPFSYFLMPCWPTMISLLCILLLLSFYNREGVFKNRVVNLIGVISYSLYLLQQFVLGPQEEIYGRFDWTNWACAVLLLVILTPLWSLWVEHPLTRLGVRIFPRQKDIPNDGLSPRGASIKPNLVQSFGSEPVKGAIDQRVGV